MSDDRKRKCRIFLIDWRPIVLQFFGQMFRIRSDLELVGTSETTEIPLERILSTKPDLVITDLFLHSLAGIQFVKKLHAHSPNLPILVYSMAEDPAYALMALDAGARGFTVGTREKQETLVTGIQRILRGEKYLGGGSAEAIAQIVTNSGSPHALMPAQILSPRELMVFHLIGKGMTTREIAHHISITPKTVLTHRSNIMRKMGHRYVSKLMLNAFQWCSRQGIQ